MDEHHKTLQRFLVEERDRTGESAAELRAPLADVTRALKAISVALGKAPLEGLAAPAPTPNGAGEPRRMADVAAHEIIVRACEWSGSFAAVGSQELGEPYVAPAAHAAGKYVLLVDPIDGSSSFDVGVSVGTIFSIVRRAAEGPFRGLEELLRPGAAQVCAGYALYGPSTMVVLTTGHGVHGFTLDRELGELILTHPSLTIPATTSELAVNASNQRFWEPPVVRYIAECLAGSTGPRGQDFNMRWVASLVADVHRIVVRGGVFVYPRDSRESGRAGSLRLLYEANPMALLVEQAGGAASTGRERVLDVVPASLHQTVPLILGSKAEVERLARYHREHDEGVEPFRDPLFSSRSLFWAS